MGRTTGYIDLSPLDLLAGNGCLGRRLRVSHTTASLELSAATPSHSSTSSSHSKCRALTDKPISSFLGVATPVEVHAGKPPELALARHRGAINLRHPEQTSFFFFSGKKCGDEFFPIRNPVDNCSDCKKRKRKCNSNDCQMYEGECYDRLMGEGKQPMNSWGYYWGATRPYLETRDWIHYGDRVWVYGPGKPKEGAKSTPREENRDKGMDAEGDEGKRVMIDFYKPGVNPETNAVNKMRITGSSLKPYPPWRIWNGSAWIYFPPMPRSREAEIAIAMWMQMMYGGKLQDYLGLVQKPCDYFGRILDGSKDHKFCNEDQVCVTSLPDDFDKVAGKMCWKWVEPAQGSGQAAHWMNVCKVNAGQPWCVPDSMIKAYDGPIEIKCIASGEKVRGKGYFNGCHWFEINNPSDENQRLPGKVLRRYGEPGGIFVKDRKKYPNALEEKDAAKWIEYGYLDLEKQKRDEQEFLFSQAKPPEPKMAGGGVEGKDWHRGWLQWIADSWRHKSGLPL